MPVAHGPDGGGGDPAVGQQHACVVPLQISLDPPEAGEVGDKAWLSYLEGLGWTLRIIMLTGLVVQLFKAMMRTLSRWAHPTALPVLALIAGAGTQRAA